MTKRAAKSPQHAGKPPLLLPAKLAPLSKLPPPSLDELKVDKEQCRRAVAALVANVSKQREKREETDLLEMEDRLDLVVTLKRMAPREMTMPIRLPVPHPPIDPRTQSVCLLVKDPQRHYKDLLKAKNIGFISRVIGVTKLKGKFKPFEARRQLLKEHDLFLADDNIIPMLPKLLGKQWLEAKKTPIPVTLSRIDLKAELERALAATYLHLGRGTCVAVKIGPLSPPSTDSHSFTTDQLLANLLSVIPHLAVRIPLGGWGNVQSLALKTSRSAALPIWSCSLDAEVTDQTSRFYVAPRTEEPPHPTRPKRLSMKEFRADLYGDEGESRATSIASPAPTAVKKGKRKAEGDVVAGKEAESPKRVKKDHTLPPTERSAMAKRVKPVKQRSTKV